MAGGQWLKVSNQCALMVQQTYCTLRCLSLSVASRPKEVILLCLSLTRPCLGSCGQCVAPQYVEKILTCQGPWGHEALREPEGTVPWERRLKEHLDVCDRTLRMWKIWIQTLLKEHSGRTKGNGHNLEPEKLYLDIRNSFCHSCCFLHFVCLFYLENSQIL